MQHLRSKAGTVGLESKKELSVDETAQMVFVGTGNLYAFWGEENSYTEDVFMHFFDVAALGDVALGTRVFTWRIPKAGGTGRDPSPIPLHNFAKGLAVSVTTSRSNITLAPAAPATVHAWYWNVN